jgi:two-component system, cell cycle response regulator DivK
MRKILIVEDVEYNRDLLVQLLEEEYEILTAADGAAGIEAAAQNRPDLILMDLSLPGVDGWEATGRLSRSRPHAAALATTMAAPARILILDDEPFNCDALVRELELLDRGPVPT